MFSVCQRLRTGDGWRQDGNQAVTPFSGKKGNSSNDSSTELQHKNHRKEQISETKLDG